MAGVKSVLSGTVIDAPSPTHLRVRPAAHVGVGADGCIEFVMCADDFEARSPSWSRDKARQCVAECRCVVEVAYPSFVCPGFIDLHAHAPQAVYSGSATDRPLMEWLQQYAFPAERSLGNDPERVNRVFSSAVHRSMKHGTSTCVWFSTLHVDVSLRLAGICGELGQRAFVGKVSMDRHGADGYEEASAEAAVSAASDFVDSVRAMRHGSSSPLVQPCICPRFVPTCSEGLLRGLAELRKRKGPLLVTTHVAESRDEVMLCRELAAAHGGEARDAVVLARHGLLDAPSVSAHAVHLSEAERRIFAEVGAGVAHCPLSNFYFADAIMPAKKFVSEGVKVGLATDVAGGYEPSMLTAIRHAVTASLALASGSGRLDESGPDPAPPDRSTHAVDFTHAFWMATVGGAAACGLGGRVGLLQAGMEFDAQVIDPAAGDRAHIDPGESVLSLFEKWINLGDDRNVTSLWVQGREVLRGGRTTNRDAVRSHL